jgi:transposase
MTRAKACGLGWEQIQALGDEVLEERLYGGRSRKRLGRGPLPDPAYLHMELRRTGVTLQLLHLEYLEREPTGYRYTSFCAHYKKLCLPVIADSAPFAATEPHQHASRSP